jgi:hypothetical protein
MAPLSMTSFCSFIVTMRALRINVAIRNLAKVPPTLKTDQNGPDARRAKIDERRRTSAVR